MSGSNPKRFDINSKTAVEASNIGAEIEIIAPDGESSGIFILIAGIDSDAYKSANRKVISARLSRLQNKRKNKHATDDMAREDIELVVACVKSWRGLTDGENDHPFSTEHAINLFTDHPWIKEQVDEAIADRTLFIKS